MTSATKARKAEAEERFAIKRERILTRADGSHITYYDIARGTELHVTFINRVFNRHRRMSMKSAEKVAAYIGCSIDALNALLRHI